MGVRGGLVRGAGASGGCVGVVDEDADGGKMVAAFRRVKLGDEGRGVLIEGLGVVRKLRPCFHFFGGWFWRRLIVGRQGYPVGLVAGGHPPSVGFGGRYSRRTWRGSSFRCFWLSERERRRRARIRRIWDIGGVSG